jgi:hypothetical protein
MRDVTDSDKTVRGIAKFILQFLKHPIREIANLPSWSWKILIWVQVILSMISGVLAGLAKPNFFGVLFGIIVMPIISTLMVSLLTAFLYYYFQVFERRSVGATRLFTLALFSSIPFFVFQIASPLIPPITLIGFAFSAMLLAVGLSENFQLDKKRAVRLAIVLFAVVMLVWVGNQVNNYRVERAATNKSTEAFQ